MAEVDRDGLDKNDRRYLETLIDVFGGGPTGVEALAATLNLATDTLADEIEPFLLREQYIVRSPRGRKMGPSPWPEVKCRVCSGISRKCWADDPPGPPPR